MSKWWVGLYFRGVGINISQAFLQLKITRALLKLKLNNISLFFNMKILYFQFRDLRIYGSNLKSLRHSLKDFVAQKVETYNVSCPICTVCEIFHSEYQNII